MTASHPDPLDARAAQEQREQRGERRPITLGARVRILGRCDNNSLLTREANAMREAGYEGVVTKRWAGKENCWRVDFGDEYCYFAPDEIEVLS